jgi:hypothetical protein
LLLSFAPPGGWLDDSVRAGQSRHATLRFYPGSGQYRALVGEELDVLEPVRLPEAETFAEVLDRWAALLAADPWATRMPAVILAAAIPPTGRNIAWRLREADGAFREVSELPGEPWPLLARSMGEPTPIFGEWTPTGFRPISLLPDDQDRSFSTDIGGQAA